MSDEISEFTVPEKNGRLDEHFEIDKRLEFSPSEEFLYCLCYPKRQTRISLNIRRQPVLVRDYHDLGLDFRHICPISSEVVRRIHNEPSLIRTISTAIHQAFWTLIECGVDPKYTLIKFFISSDIDEPYHNELVMKVSIPSDIPLDWMDLWTYLDEKIFNRIHPRLLTTQLERFDYESLFISSIRQDTAKHQSM